MRPDILMIGSAGRNAGKTLLACDLIRRYASTQSLVAVKVTTIKEESGGACPRGEVGCGVCGDFHGRYDLAQVHDGPPNKDTTRLLEAGASKVFWLRVRDAHLAEGIEATLKLIPDGQPAIWESNSARRVLTPAAFLVLREKGNARIKESCQRVMDVADRILDFDGTGWDLSPDRITFSAGCWHIRQDAAAIVLAGGQSRRMGQDKNFLPVAGRPMIEHIVRQLEPWFDDVFIGANDPAKFAFLQRRVVPDREPGMGPLMGLLSCLAESRHDLNFVTACDIPTLDPHFLMRMIQAAEGYDIVMPHSLDRRPEPLLAVYRKSVCASAEQVLLRGGRRMSDLFELVKVKTVTMPESDWYRNLNTPEDYHGAVTANATGGSPL
ncbi:MAG: molybdenum cofactor guanylyltransferase [bacterium]